MGVLLNCTCFLVGEVQACALLFGSFFLTNLGVIFHTPPQHLLRFLFFVYYKVVNQIKCGKRKQWAVRLSV